MCWKPLPNQNVSKFCFLSAQPVILTSLVKCRSYTTGYSYLRFDGSTASSTRQTIIDQFNNDPKIMIFFISTKAGGLGLNLTSASRVIVFDVNWNPTHDLQVSIGLMKARCGISFASRWFGCLYIFGQAMDRAYRLGQQKEVQVFRLVSQGTIEELCYMRQIYKQQLNDVALGGVRPPRGKWIEDMVAASTTTHY